MPETKREKFIRIAENRTNKIIQMIRNLSNLSNKSNYEYDDEDIRKIFSVIDKEIKIAKLKFNEKDIQKFRLR